MIFPGLARQNKYVESLRLEFLGGGPFFFDAIPTFGYRYLASSSFFVKTCHWLVTNRQKTPEISRDIFSFAYLVHCVVTQSFIVLWNYQIQVFVSIIHQLVIEKIIFWTKSAKLVWYTLNRIMQCCYYALFMKPWVQNDP